MADLTSLQQSLINAKKVMNKVDSGNVTKGNISLPQGDINEAISQIPNNIPQLPNVNTDMASARKDLSPKASITEEKILNSKLPENIKKLMIENPIPDVPMGSSMGLSDDFLSGVKDAMSKQDIPTSTTQKRTVLESNTPTATKSKITKSSLKSIIKESVKELVNESVNMKTDTNENFSFRSNQ